MSTEAYDAAVSRLSRNMAVAQAALVAPGVTAFLFDVQVDSVRSACAQLEEAGRDIDRFSHLVHVDKAFGPATAELLAKIIETPTPDTIPESWKD